MNRKINTPKQRFLRGIALFLALVMLNEILFPTVAFALTSMGTQPEVWGYQPVDATDNVSLTSGKFNYTIPITSIPEYPMAIGYSSGLGMEQESGVFGFGFSGFSGAIARSMNGLPDDVLGAQKKYDFSNQKMWDASLKGTLGKSLGGTDPPKEIGGVALGLGASVSFQIGYNNYTGAYGAVGVGFGAAGKMKIFDKLQIFPAGGIGGGLISDSRKSGIGFGVGASVGISYDLYGGGKFQGGGFESVGGVGVNKVLDNKAESWKTAASIASSLGKSVFSGTTSNSSSALAPLCYVLPATTGFGASLTVPLPFPPPMNLSVTGTFSQFKSGDGEIMKDAYGFMYLKDHDRSNRDQISDVTIEGENSFDGDARNVPSYLQKDFFSVNTMGMAGSMQLYQNKNGVVSRNYSRTQYRNFSLPVSIKTERKEVYPWTNVIQSSFKKGLDILALLKKKQNPEDKDFDKILFNEKELLSLNTAKQKFGEAEFKMRGDMAGEFDLSSVNYKDHSPNIYDLVHVPGSSDNTSVQLLGLEKQMPLYYPSSLSEDYSSGPIEKSTQITKRTMNDLISAYGFLNIDPEDQSTPAKATAAFNFNQSFYSHYTYSSPESKIADMVTLGYPGNNLESMNILQHVHDIDKNLDPNNSAYFKNLIGSIEMRSANGLRYFFNLPVFNKTTKTLQLSGGGMKAPEIDGDDYSSFKKNNGNLKNRNKVTTTDDFMYPYAWLLTAAVGDDYIDFDEIPGPSDGDIGYWVKFKYVKVADNYKWRAPFTGLSHIPMALHDPADDAYVMTGGEKEIYYLSEVESSGYLCSYTYKKRYDALDAKGYVNGEAYNSLAANESITSEDYTGNNFQFLVAQIDLYKKHNSGDNSAPKTVNRKNLFGTPIKSTRFEFDYSTCPGVLNNVVRTSSITKGMVDYYYGKAGHENESIGTGKATLRKVQHIAYDEAGTPIILPSYEFKYWGDPDPNDPNAGRFNPSYNKEMMDQWGSYVKNSKVMGSPVGVRSTVAYYNHYPELVKDNADENAKVYAMKQILLPSGGSMNIDYQAQSYGKVEDKTPYVMRHVKIIAKEGITNYTRVTIDVTDIGSQGLVGAKVLKPGDPVYGEIAFYQEPGKPLDESKLYMSSSDKVKVVSIPGTAVFDNTDNKWYQDVILENSDPLIGTIQDGKKNPFIGDCEIHMYTESAQMRSLKESLNGCNGANTALDKYLDMEKDDAWVAAKKIVANVRNVFRTDGAFQGNFDICFGHPGSVIFSGLSFLRTPIYKGKYTGSVVSKIELKDNFNYATMTNGTAGHSDATDNSYGTRYFYDEKGDGTGVSSGVASIEPGGGKSCVLDVYDLKGAGFAPAPQIISSRTTMENLYHADNLNAVAGDKVSRKKGKTVYEFYTAKDDGMRFRDNFREGGLASQDGKPHGYLFLFGILVFLKIKIPVKKYIKIPVLPLPCVVRCNRHDNYFVKGYSYTDNTDVFGRPKSIIQMDASGQELGRQTFSYYGMDEPVNMYKDNFNAPNAKQKPGKMDQVWSEAYYTKESKISMVPLLLTLNTETDRNLCYTNMKYSYIPPTLKEVTSTIDGLETVTTNTGFDYYTGTPIEVRSNDSYKNTKIVRTVPAYWKYYQMGPATAANPGYINNLTATTGTYMYLNQVDNNHLLGAGIVEWSSSATSNTWNLIDYVQPWKQFTDPGYKYNYTLRSGATVLGNYQNPTIGSNKYIQRNPVIFKTYKGYTYEADLRAKGSMDGGTPNMPNDGTFTSFSDFNYPSGVGNASNWKLLSTNQLYSVNGVLIQSKDILNKYASQLLGYNFSNTVGAVSNASFGASVHEGAENTYANVTGKKMLEGDRVQLVDAEVIKACTKTFTEKTLDLNNFPKDQAVPTPHTLGHIIAITQPAVSVYNTTLSKLNVTYSNGAKRILLISLNDNGNYELNSTDGEAFEGFFEFRQSATSVKLIFNPNECLSIKLLSSSSSGYFFSLALNDIVPPCTVATKKYRIPTDCTAEVHTGSYAFKLYPKYDGQAVISSVGTRYILSPSTVTTDEFKRKYKAMVWVHTSSPDQTELVVKKSSGDLVTSKATPYAKAGNWVLLRLDFDLSNENYMTANNVQVFVRNNSAGGNSIYDDLRILPYHADMTNWVFDHAFNRVVSGLDNDNFASYSNYDARGRVMESAVELQDVGKNTVQKFLYNDQKKQ